jgi:hypothetical protein
MILEDRSATDEDLKNFPALLVGLGKRPKKSTQDSEQTPKDPQDELDTRDHVSTLPDGSVMQSRVVASRRSHEQMTKSEPQSDQE